MQNAPKLNLINRDKWDKKEKLQFVQQRLQAMRSKKEPFTKKFAEYETQETALSYYDNFGQLQVVPPVEQNLIEIYMGRTNGKVRYDILPEEQADIDELQPSKYIMQRYLDGNEVYNFWKENKDFRHNKALYGTGVFFTGIRVYKDVRHKVKEDVALQSGTDILNESNFDEYTHETWMFFPESLHPNDYYHDDAAYGVPDLQYAEDAIYKEKMSLKEFQLQFKDNKAIDKEVYESITFGTDIDEKNKNSTSIDQEEVVIHYYFNRVSKDYMIMVNEDKLLYAGLFLNDDGKLPFVSAQHFPNNNCFWGRGVPEKIMYLKVYKGEILQDILNGAAMANSVNFLTGEDNSISQNWSVGGRGVNIWESTNGIEQTQQISTNINLNYFASVLQIIDDLLVQDTGDNVRSPIDASSDKVGIVEIMEANKAVRQSAVDEGYNLALDEALTMMLHRVKTFAPSLESEKIMSEDGEKILKIIYPKIRIPDAKVEQKGDKITITEDYGKFGYFEMKPMTIRGLGVKVATSSTSSILPIIQRERVNDYINNLVQLGNLSQMIPDIGKKLTEYVNPQDLVDWIDEAYGRDSKLRSYTKKDKITQDNRQKKAELMEKMKNSMLQLNQSKNAPTENPMNPQAQRNNVQAQGLGSSGQLPKENILGATGI